MSCIKTVKKGLCCLPLNRQGAPPVWAAILPTYGGLYARSVARIDFGGTAKKGVGRY